MAKIHSLPRTTQTIIEPGTFEKNVIRTLMDDIRALTANHTQLGFEIQQFAAEVKQDFFSPLIKSPHVNVQLIGHAQRDLAADLAIAVAQSFCMHLAAYIDELGTVPVERKRLVIDFMATKQDLGGQLPKFEVLSDEEKAIFHLERISKLFLSLVQIQALATCEGIDVKQLKKEPKYIKMCEELEKSGRTPYNIPARPQLIGVAYLYMMSDVKLFQQLLMLGGMRGDELEYALAARRKDRTAQFTTPRTLIDPNLVKGRFQFDTMNLGAGRAN